ncbi:hypothetical protein [Streptomyces sp. cg35]
METAHEVGLSRGAGNCATSPHRTRTRRHTPHAYGESAALVTG